MPKPHAQVAVDFASALISGSFDKAASYLAPSLRDDLTPTRLQDRLHAMYRGYADGPPNQIWFNETECCWDSSDPKHGDLGWVYVGISGDDFNEAVTVLVCSVDDALLIREIQWGRP